MKTHCLDHGRVLVRRNIPCPDGIYSGCIALHYEMHCPRCEELAKADADAKLGRLILRKFREENPALHLSTCDQTRVVHPSGDDSMCGEGTCEIARLEATIKCPCGQRREFEWHDWGTMADLFQEMDEA